MTPFDPTNPKHIDIVTDVQRAIAAQVGRHMFDANRANICQDCRGLKVTNRTPSRMFKNRTICNCNEAP